MTDTNNDAGAKPGFFAYWAPPVAIGLLVGLGIVFAVRYLNIGQSEVDQIVEQYEWGVHENNQKLEEQVAQLGTSARRDVVKAFEQAEGGDWADMKVWIGEMLLREPFFDSDSLSAAARGDDVWSRRCAAAALARQLREEADPDVVMPGLMDWLTDLSTDDHEIAVHAVAALGPLPAEWRQRTIDALVGLATKRPPVAADPADDWLPEDREVAIQSGLHVYVTEERVKELMYTIAADDEDDYRPRVAALRALSENLLFDNFDAWAAAGKAADETVRQTVADNLFRTQERAFGAILEPMHLDAHSPVRQGSIDTQIVRRQETMLPVMDQLLEDHDLWVRFGAMEACAVFKNSPGAEARSGQLLRIFAESESPTDVEGAVLALYSITKQTFGFREIDVRQNVQEVEASALTAFMKDTEGRAEAVKKFQDVFGGTAVWTKDDRIATLEKLREHADPENRAHAEKLLAELK